MRMKLTLQGLQLARGQRLLQLKFLVPRPLKILVSMRSCQNNDVVPNDLGKNVNTSNQCVQRALFELLSRNIPRRHQNPMEAHVGDDVKDDAKNIARYATKPNRFGDRIAVNYRENGRRQPRRAPEKSAFDK